MTNRSDILLRSSLLYCLEKQQEPLNNFTATGIKMIQLRVGASIWHWQSCRRLL